MFDEISNKNPNLVPYLDKVLNRDSFELLKELPTESVDVMITSPPYYSQRDYGHGIGNEKTLDEYIDKIVDIFEKCVSVVNQNGSLFVNMGDKYQDGSLLLSPYKFAEKAIQRTGVKLINIITWVKPNPEPRQFKRRLVNSTEPFFHFVKSNTYNYYPEKFNCNGNGNLLRSKKKNINTNIGRSYFDLIESSDLSEGQKQLAREELEAVISEVKEGNISSFRMKIRGIHSASYGGYEGGRKDHIRKKGYTIIRMSGQPLKKDVIECPILSLKYLNHPAIYPEFLVEELLNLTTIEGDIVLDPFLGSGTTAIVAKRMGRHYIGIDINREYCELAMERLRDIMIQPSLNKFCMIE